MPPLVILLLCTALSAAGPRIATAPARITLAADSEQQWVPFDLTPGNQIRFRMTLDDHPVTAILDTGVSHSVLARASVAVRADRLRPAGTASAIGGDVAIQWMPTTRLALGGLIRSGGGLTVAPLPANATGSAVPIDLLVGRDLTGDHALDIDYPARRFRLLPSGRLPFRGQVAPLSVSRERQVYESAVVLGGQAIGPMVVDTGDGAAVTLSRERWTRVAPAGVRTTTALSFGLGGELISDLAILPAIGLGELTTQEVEVRVEPAGGFSATLGTAGRIGSGLLQHYRVLLDPRAGRMVLSPGPLAGSRPLRSTSGLLVSAVGDRLRVLHVMRGSPGETGGWVVGDTVCAIGGRSIPPDYQDDPLAGWSVARPGTVTRLSRCDGGERVLVARSFY